ncbi:MAG TPA: TonB-dependent receptor [Vicinamibacterales bacterium]|nr:TonB-dependent receptor [Vicinamibacterales bacterium]
MNRLLTLAATTVVAGLAWTTPAEAQPRASALGDEHRLARMTSGASGLIEGVVVDERGAPLPGVTVSALGSVTALAVTDRRGGFTLKALPPGEYVVRAHLAGFAPSPREFVRVGPGRSAKFSATLERSGPTEAWTPVLAAGFGPTGDREAGPGGDTDEESEKTWRLRHLRRSILKGTTERVALADEEEHDRGGGFSLITRAVGSSADFIADLPLTGAVNFLTSGSFDAPDGAVTATSAVRRTAFVSIGGPAFGHGDWEAQVMTQGGLGSWFVAGSYQTRAPSSHLFDLGVTYSTQRFTSGSRWPLSAESDGVRSAGMVYGVDRWTLSPKVTLTYGGRYAHYDYLPAGLFSPQVHVGVAPAEGLLLTGSASRRMLAPGAEEFVPPLHTGLWVPPEHSFNAAARLDPEATGHYEIGVEQDIWRDVVVTVRAFVQRTSHQQLALFDTGRFQQVRTGHYEVTDSGNLEARGWTVGLSGSPWRGTRGSVAYSTAAAEWVVRPPARTDMLLVGIGPRSRERIHDLTTRVESEIPPTATTVVFTYKLNSAFARQTGEGVQPGLDGRFEVRIMQPLPFLDFTSAHWEALVGFRNLFRDATADASIYDELLVVGPPKRVVGGLMVRF